MVKQFLRSAGVRGLPQGSPLSPLFANLALTDLDHALDRGRGFLTYVRYLDDMVVVAPASEKGRKWAARALDSIRREAEAIGVSLNTEKTRIVTITDESAVFAFLGFEFRWVRSEKTSVWYPCVTPQPKKITALLRKVRDTLRACRHLSVQEAVARVNPILRGWVNYFRVGNSSQAFDKVKYHVERKVRRFAAKKSKRKGFGWKRWSSDIVYDAWGLSGTTASCMRARKRAPGKRNHNPDGRRLRGEPDAENLPVRFDVAGTGDGVMATLHGHEAGNGGYSQGYSLHTTAPVPDPTVDRQK